MNKKAQVTQQPVRYVIYLVIGIAIILVIAGVLSERFAGIGAQISKYVFFGTEDISVDVATTTGEIGGIITAFMIWLIIFVGFGDILENFSAFSKGIAWVIAFAIAVVAANVGLIQSGIIALVGLFAWLGTFAMFAAMLGAFVAFFAVNWGMSSLGGWLKRRQTMLKAATGRTYASEGLRTLKQVGKTTAEE